MPLWSSKDSPQKQPEQRDNRLFDFVKYRSLYSKNLKRDQKEAQTDGFPPKIIRSKTEHIGEKYIQEAKPS